MYLNTYECNDGEIRGISQFLTANYSLKEGDKITFCNTDFGYDIGESSFSNDEKEYWYSVRLRLEKTYSDDPSRPAIGGSSGNYEYKEYIIEAILASGFIETDEDGEYTYLLTDWIYGLAELAHVPTFNYKFDVDIDIEKKYGEDLDKLIDKSIAEKDTHLTVFYNTGYYQYYYCGEYRKIYNPHHRREYTVHLEDHGMGWAMDCNSLDGMQPIAVYIRDIYKHTECLYL